MSNSGVFLVAKREFLTRLRMKSFVISNIVTIVILVGGVIVYGVFFAGKTSTTSIGVVGSASVLADDLKSVGQSTGLSVDVVNYADEAAAKDAASNGDVEVALVPDRPDHYVALTKSDLDKTVQAVVESVIKSRATAAALASAKVDVAALTAATAAAGIDVQATNPPDPDEGQRIALAIVGVILLVMGVMTYAVTVAVGVVEEKSSRVVELLLSTVTPYQLLWGKIIGLGAVGLCQVVVTSVAGLIAGLATGVVTLAGTAVWLVVAVIGWFILGFLFFAVLYAAAGSLVSRQEEVNSTTAPITILAMATIYSAFFGVGALDSTFMRVLAWIPPFTATVMPMRIATGDASGAQIIITVVLTLAAIGLLSVIAVRVYQRSVLRTGSRLSWAEALGHKRSAKSA